MVGGSTGWHCHEGANSSASVKDGHYHPRLSNCSVAGLCYKSGDPIIENAGADHVHLEAQLGTGARDHAAVLQSTRGKTAAVDARTPVRFRLTPSSDPSPERANSANVELSCRRSARLLSTGRTTAARSGSVWGIR